MGAIHQALLSVAPPAGGGGDFDTTNMFFRLRAADVVGLSNGDPMGTWLDTSGNGYDFSPTNGPTWRSADGPNSQPCVRFAAASSQYFTGPDWSPLALTEIDLFIILLKNADPAVSLATAGLWSFNDVTSDVFRLCLVPFTDGNVYDTPFTVGTRTSNNFATTFAQWNQYRVKNQHAVGSAFNNFLNGVAGSTPQTNGVVSPSTTYLGRSKTASNDAYCDGDIAEIFGFSAFTAGAQLTSINDYFLSFYSL